MVQPPGYQDLGRWILDQEVARRGDGAFADAAEAAVAAIYMRLAPLITLAGSQAFLTRSLHLARDQFPFLHGLRGGATPETCLDGLADALQGVDEAAVREALAAVMGNMIGLLVAFIGEDIALRVLADAWPDAPLELTRQEERR